MDPLVIPLAASAMTVAVVIILALYVLENRPQSARMLEIAGYIQSGTRAYLLRQFKTMSWFITAGAGAIFLALGSTAAVTFLAGCVLSLFASYLGMNMAVQANVRAADAARTSSSRAFRLAFLGGSVMGLCVTGLSLTGLCILYVVLRRPEDLIGFGFGASLTALFAQVGGGIYTKAADIGADLVGKVELGLPEDDPRNPAVIADLVGDNVGDCAGRGSDLFQSFSGDIVTGMVLGITFVDKYGPNAIVFPLVLQAIGILGSILGILVIRQWRNWRFTGSLNLGLCTSAIVSTVGSYLITVWLLDDLSIFYSIASGLLATIVALSVAHYYTGPNGKPIRRMAEASERGAAISIITGMAYAYQSPFIPIIAVIGSVALSYLVSGFSLYALVAANIGTDLLIGVIMSSDAFGPIVDNAGGIAEMAGVKEADNTLRTLDAVGNTMKASTKAYAMASGTLTAFVIFATFFQVTRTSVLDVTRPFSLAFLFIGVALPFLTSSFALGSTAKTALLMVDEVRRQLRERPGILRGLERPDYARCVDVSTRNALGEMFFPGLIAIVPPMLAGFVFGHEDLGGLLIGTTASAAVLAPFFNNLGAAFDNAKKMIETGFLGGKGTDTHKAAVIGDTVGDSLKDVAGPSLLIFMKLVGMTALMIAPLLKL